MFKQLFYRYFTLFMAVLVLTSSVGVGLIEKECMTRGKSVALAYKNKEDHCKLCRATNKPVKEQSHQDAPVFKKQHCCLETQQLKHVEIQVGASKKSQAEPTTPEYQPAFAFSDYVKGFTPLPFRRLPLNFPPSVRVCSDAVCSILFGFSDFDTVLRFFSTLDGHKQVCLLT